MLKMTQQDYSQPPSVKNTFFIYSFHQYRMKRINLTLLFLSLTYLSTFAQGQYGETLRTQTIYPIETAQFFRSGQGNMPLHPSSMSPNFYQNAPVAAYVLEGFYLFKRNKKRPKINYAKKSHIVRF